MSSDRKGVQGSVSSGLAEHFPPHMQLLQHLLQSTEDTQGKGASGLLGEELYQSRWTKSICFFGVLRLFVALHNPEHCAADTDKTACCILLEEDCLSERELVFLDTYFSICFHTEVLVFWEDFSPLVLSIVQPHEQIKVKKENLNIYIFEDHWFPYA